MLKCQYSVVYDKKTFVRSEKLTYANFQMSAIR